MKSQHKQTSTKNVFLRFLLLLRNNILFLFYVVHNAWLRHFTIHNSANPDVVLSETDQYIQKYTSKLLQSFKLQSGEEETANDTKFSNNIFQAFYSKEELQNILVTPNNFIEEEWKRRILFENTPRGNIVMYYDAYKQGFAYYSDSYSIPYSVLNAVAMKYVLTFICRDFFVDNQITPKSSPLIKILLEEETKPKDSLNNKNPKFMNDLKDAPFAKFKNYAKSAEKSAVNQSMVDELTLPKVDVEYTRNRFIYLGKMSNFMFIQKTLQRSPINGFSSALLDNLSGETSLQKKVLDYKSYKKMAAET